MSSQPSTPLWTDTHCHLQLLDTSDAGARAVHDAARAGVVRVVCVGIDVATSEGALAAARRHPNVYPTVGLHPHEAQFLDEQWPDIERLATHESTVAIGECGLDYFRDHSPRDAQAEAFRRQIALAKQRRLALVIHTRDAWDDCLSILEDAGPPDRFVFHCFSGGPEHARRCVDLGAHISFAGPISYPRNDDLRAAARIAPLERIVVETDAPFLSPQKFRGKPNNPARVALVGATLAEVRGAGAADIAAATSSNAARLFGLPEITETR